MNQYISILFFSVVVVLLLFLLFKWRRQPKQYLLLLQTSASLFTIPTNWPVLGMLPGLLQHSTQIVLWLTSVNLQAGGSFMLKGPWFSKMELFITADPANVQHIMSKRYDDFHKGSNFNEIFDVLGDGIFNVDHQLWKYQRKIAHSTFTGQQFRKFLANTIKDKLEHGLLPILERAYKEELVVDLQDLFTRFTSDVTFITIMGHDPGSLSVDLPDNPVSDYIHNVESNLLMRHLLPESIWKLKRWLGVGSEKEAQQSMEGAERIIYDCIARKMEEVEEMKLLHENKNIQDDDDDDRGVDLLTYYIMENYGNCTSSSDQQQQQPPKAEYLVSFPSTAKFLRDTLATLLSAGQDTTSVGLAWFFWLLLQNSEVETKIKQELQQNNIDNIDAMITNTNKLVYLHGAVCEALRLYPPVPFNHKASLEPLVLPSGHKVNPWTMIILNAFAMGRMKSIWGDDCLEFKPDRWITDQRTIKHEPSHKFFTFNAGPRICLGKEMALVQMKAAISTVFQHHFHFQLVEGQSIEPGFSIVLVMKKGLKVKVFKKKLYPGTIKSVAI